MQDINKTIEDLLEFIKKSPTCYQGIENISVALEEKGFERLNENEYWEIVPGKGYYVIRNGSSVIAFHIPENRQRGFRVVAAHSDSPTFKLKENPETEKFGYQCLNVEKYGGMILSTWFDRPLSIAGRIVVEKEAGTGSIADSMEAMNVDLEENVAMIVNLAIHMQRTVNGGHEYDVQKELMPICGLAENKKELYKRIAEKAGIEADRILSSDLFLYNNEDGKIWGMDQEFFSAPRIDNLQCTWVALQGFLKVQESDRINVYCVFDNEEVGSGTKQGADSTFLEDTLRRVENALGKNDEDYYVDVAESYMLSADNGHAIHPNYPEKADITNRPLLNKGPIFKIAANQRYCTDAVSAAFFKKLCKDEGIEYQVYANNSNVPGGSTLGNISASHVSLKTVDMGVAQLGMHSSYETAGTKDAEALVKLFEAFYGR